MKIPNCDRAEIPESKIIDYLLALGHPEGGPKATFFLNWGFTQNEWHILASALIRQANENVYTDVVEGKYGLKYIVIAPIESPAGITPPIKTIWMIPHDGEHPRLITAYPAT